MRGRDGVQLLSADPPNFAADHNACWGNPREMQAVIAPYYPTPEQVIVILVLVLIALAFIVRCNCMCCVKVNLSSSSTEEGGGGEGSIGRRRITLRETEFEEQEEGRPHLL